MAAGELKTAISFSEPGGGTDLLGGMKSTAEKIDGGWVINGEKIWSTGADSSDYLLLIARTDKNVEKISDGVSLFFVPSKSEGITMTPLPKLGMRALSSCSILWDAQSSSLPVPRMPLCAMAPAHIISACSS